MKARQLKRRIGPVEQLEPRFLLSGLPGGESVFGLGSVSGLHPLIVAGDPAGTPADSTDLRIDPNTTTSPFAGVGSLEMVTRHGAGSCTATPIHSRFVITAAHCIDLNDDGRSNKRDGLLSITFILNFGSDMSHQILVSAWQTHPDYTGFNRPSVNDDLAILTLSTPLPAGVPIYSRYTGAFDRTLILVGYGTSGDGVTGFYLPASNTVKRRGENIPDLLSGQDDFGRASVNEVFAYDFDGPTGNGPLGGPTLGNHRETTAGPGDSGGPSFVLIDTDPTQSSSYAIAGVNTFNIDGSMPAPLFGSMAGGMILGPYEAWIQAVLSGKKFNAGGIGGSAGSVARGGTFRPPSLYHMPISESPAVTHEVSLQAGATLMPNATETQSASRATSLDWSCSSREHWEDESPALPTVPSSRWTDRYVDPRLVDNVLLLPSTGHVLSDPFAGSDW